MADPIIIDDTGGLLEKLQPALRVWDKNKTHKLDGLKTKRAEIHEKLTRLVVFIGDYPTPTILDQVDGKDLDSFTLETRRVASVQGKYDGRAGSEVLTLLASDPMYEDTRDPFSYYMKVIAQITNATVQYRSTTLRVDFEGYVKIALVFG